MCHSTEVRKALLGRASGSCVACASRYQRRIVLLVSQNVLTMVGRFLPATCWNRIMTMVRRIRLGNIFNIAMTGKGKIVVSRRTLPGVHYTVNLSGKSGVFDFHRTTE